MKKYECQYRLRGVPNTPIATTEIEANNYFEATSKATELVGPVNVVLKVTQIKEEKENAV